MRYLLGALIIVVILLGARELHSYWEQVRARHHGESSSVQVFHAPTEDASTKAPAAAVPETLAGLPPQLESSLEAAKRQGATALALWLKQNRSQVQDPRLAAIELDYVVAVAGRNFGEAREVFAAVRARTPTNSPVYPRLRKMQRSYE